MEGENRQLVIGILAHVDAGKTTLSESILYHCNAIRKPGRVDHGDTFLDTYSLERERGITIFSKQAIFTLGDRTVTLLDTPGHVDFSAEMERTLCVLDYAVLVISGTDGIQGHVLTLWKLLKRYEIPTFLFVNKMDQPGTDPNFLMRELSQRLDERCIRFGEENEAFFESLAMCSDSAMEEYLADGRLSDDRIAGMIRKREVFPCFFGSALKDRGVTAFLMGLERFLRCPVYPEAFGAKVFKITRDTSGSGTRLSWMKITGGSLKVKQTLTNQRKGSPKDPVSGEIWEEKADQIRLYSGDQFRTVKEAPAGTVCAVAGLEHTFAGEGLGEEPSAERPVLEPVLTYRILLPEGCDVHSMYRKLGTLEEEEPELHIVWDEHSGEIRAQVMGAVQMEILQHLIKERFGTEVSFGAGSIAYRETIAKAVEGVGHFEPLRHYAEVHLLLEPAERGSGISIRSDCSEDVLDGNWQRLILTHLEEKKYRGVLTGSFVTDLKITLLTGRAHLKHTEGGDFREATYRAVRQGLKSAESVLLEPVYEFSMEIPAECVGRALNDLQKMQASFSLPEQQGERSIIKGSVPVSELGDYQKEIAAYSRGAGRLFCTLKGYEPCHNAEEVIARIGYDSETDLSDPTGSVFCAHGAGFLVPWNEVPQYMHLQSSWSLMQKRLSRAEDGETEREADPVLSQRREADRQAASGKLSLSLEQDKELEEIFIRTYGPIKRNGNGLRNSSGILSVKKEKMPEDPFHSYLLVDGYNIIYDWDELRELAAADLAAARLALMDILSNYQGYKGCTVILVFDAYRVEGHPGEVQKYHNIYVVYTMEAETADQYIEKTVICLEKDRRVTVATSDGIEQVIIMGQGAVRMSAAGLKEEVETVCAEMRKEFLDRPPQGKTYLFRNLSPDLAEELEKIRLGKKFPVKEEPHE